MTVISDQGSAAIDETQLRSPVTRAGYEYWLRKKGDRRIPSRTDFDPLLEVPRLARHIVLVEVLRDPLDFRYRLIGTAIRENMAADWTGLCLSEIPMQKAPNPIWQHHLWVLEHRSPRFYRPAYLGPYKEFKFIESAQLPLGTDDANVEMMMVFVDFLTKVAIVPPRINRLSESVSPTRPSWRR